MFDAGTYMRHQLMKSIYAKMTDAEKLLFCQMAMQKKNHSEEMEALQRQQSQLVRLQQTQQSFASDFLSNIAGNAAYKALLWIARQLFRR